MSFAPVELEWDRYSSTEITTNKCDACGRTTRVLSVDTSDGEYGTVHYCKPCIDKEFHSDQSSVNKS